jgi:hypothetical protein
MQMLLHRLPTASSRRLFRSALLAGAVAAVGVAQAHICYVDRIRAEDSGVLVIFSTSVSRVTGSVTSRGRFTVENGLVNWRSAHTASKPEAGLHLEQGERAFLSSGLPEDGCTITFEIFNRRLGITVEASTNLPGLPPNHHTEFIPAE